MISMPDDLPDDPVLLKQILLEERRIHQVIDQAHYSQVVDLKEQIKLLRDRLFGRKSEQTVDPETPQLVLFNEAESVSAPIVETTDEEAEEVVAPVKRRGYPASNVGALGNSVQ